MEEFIGEFKIESTSIIETLQGLLLSYEGSTSKTHAAEELFRGIHTLKGTSKMFGFDSIEQVTHQIENILDDCRSNGEIFTTELTALIMRILDYCALVLEGNDAEETRHSLLDEIAAYQNKSQTEAAAKVFELYCILFTPSGDIFERGINPLGIFNELKEFGPFGYFPDKKKKSLEKQITDKKLEETIFDLWLSTDKDRSDVEDVFMFMKENEYEIIPIKKETQADEVFSKIETHKGAFLVKSERSIRIEFIASNLQQPDGNPTEIISSIQPERIENNTSQPKSEDGSKLNYINVALPKLDQMMNLVSEFVTLSGEIKHYANLLSSEPLQNIVERLEKVSTQFRDNAFSMRLVPIQILSIKLQRYVKELSSKLGKKVRLITEGMDTEIDKSIINQIEAPLMHIIRNALDHGIEAPQERVKKGKSEEGILKISAFYSGTNVFIHIQDDGAGINLEKVKRKAIENKLIQAHDLLDNDEITSLIFKAGFSTIEKVSEVSGRGVGMDVVKKNINNLRGSIDITTEKDLGTSFAIRLPLALSIMDVMIVRVGSLNYLFPHNEIEICSTEKFDHVIQRKGFNIRYKNKLIPFLNLNSLFEEKETELLLEKCIVILNKTDQLIAVEVDEIVGKEQVVIKPVDESLQMITYLSGTSILGSGDLAFLIDVLKLKELYAQEK